MTNLETDSPAPVQLCNKRGPAQEWIKDGEQVVKVARLSCPRFQPNEVPLCLSLIANNLGNL